MDMGEEEEEEEEEEGENCTQILTMEGFANVCARYNIMRKDVELRELVNDMVLSKVKEVVDAALLIAEGRGDKRLTTQHLTVAQKSVLEFPEVLF